MPKYNFLVVGCGLFGTVFAQKQVERGKKVLIIEKRGHIGGNCYTESIEGINVHKYGPHIFHTDNLEVWQYINRFASFNTFVNRPKVRYKDQMYSFPINLMTLYQLYGVKTPAEAKNKLAEVVIPNENPNNLEDWILSQVGQEVYEIFIKGYTQKQWQKEPKDLAASLIKRLPIRLTYDDNYFNDKYQGIPIGGYTKVFEKMLERVEVKLNTDYFKDRSYWDEIADAVVYTGKIDEYFDYELGALEYRGLMFENEVLEGDFQGNAVVNYTEKEIPYTRIIEHKHFEFGSQPQTIITREYPIHYSKKDVPYYPVNVVRNTKLYAKYKKIANQKKKNLLLGGRLGAYRYMDMDDIIVSVFELAEKVDFSVPWNNK